MPCGRDEELEAIATRGYVAQAIEALRTQAAVDGEAGAKAARALQLLFRLHRMGQAGGARA